MNMKITSNTNYPTKQVIRPQLGVENEPGSPDPWDGTRCLWWCNQINSTDVSSGAGSVYTILEHWS